MVGQRYWARRTAWSPAGRPARCGASLSRGRAGPRGSSSRWDPVRPRERTRGRGRRGIEELHLAVGLVAGAQPEVVGEGASGGPLRDRSGNVFWGTEGQGVAVRDRVRGKSRPGRIRQRCRICEVVAAPGLCTSTENPYQGQVSVAQVLTSDRVSRGLHSFA